MFDAGHSDSADPETYAAAMLGVPEEGDKKDESSEFKAEDVKKWDYIRCPCLGWVPGFCCPHHDVVQSNGILRATDFDKMLLRHPGINLNPKP